MLLEPEWSLKIDQARTGVENMALDRAALERLEEAAGPAILRWYTFEPACVSLGANQKPEHAVDLEACARLGIDWVMRPTGGRAVLHRGDLTYSLIARMDRPPFLGLGVEDTYALISQALVDGLRELGLAAAWVAPGHRPRKEDFLRPCFASISRHEICVEGRKLVGSAQRRLRNAFLQHGSVPVDASFRDLADLLPGDPSARARTKDELASTTTFLSEWLDQPSLEDVALACREPFQELLGSVSEIRNDQNLVSGVETASGVAGAVIGYSQKALDLG